MPAAVALQKLKRVTPFVRKSLFSFHFVVVVVVFFEYFNER